MDMTAALTDLAKVAHASRRVIVAHGHRQRMLALETDPLMMDVSFTSALISHRPRDMMVTVGAGMTVGALNEALIPHGQWVPALDRQAWDTMGGLVAAGFDSPYRAAYGSLAQRVVALRAWTPAWGEIQTGAGVVKNVAGYPLGRLFWGSRGAFGVITAMTLKVAPYPAETAVWRLVEPDEGWSRPFLDAA
jgi:glycolate oxidase FAD binding subunit